MGPPSIIILKALGNGHIFNGGTISYGNDRNRPVGRGVQEKIRFPPWAGEGSKI